MIASQSSLIAAASLGNRPDQDRGKRKLREVLRDHEDGLALGDDADTVKQAVEDWLAFGLNSRDEETHAETSCSVATTSSRTWARDASVT